MKTWSSIALLLVLAGVAAGQTTQLTDVPTWERITAEAEGRVRQKLLEDDAYKALLATLAERQRALNEARQIGDNQVKLDAMNALAKAEAAVRAYEERAMADNFAVATSRQRLADARAAAAKSAWAAEMAEYNRTEMYDAVAAREKDIGGMGDSPLRPKDPDKAFARVQRGMTRTQVIGYLGGYQGDYDAGDRLVVVWKYKRHPVAPMMYRVTFYRGAVESTERVPLLPGNL